MDSSTNGAGSRTLWSEYRLRAATDAAGIALWSWNVDTDRITMDERAFEIWGLPKRDEITFEELSSCIHPADLDKVRLAFSATRELLGAYEIDFRILHGTEVRWISARGRGDDQGIVGRIMFGVFLDVSFRKLAEETRDLVSKEMNHRVKNLFSLASSLAALSSRTTNTKADMVKDLSRRLQGLSAAHNLIMPGFHDQQQAVSLEDLLTSLLSAYQPDGEGAHIATFTAPELIVGEKSITSIAMLIHELATNSAKYGALSTDEGRIVILAHEFEGMVELVWSETNSPVYQPPEITGFGSQMIERVIKQLNGDISREWTPKGLVVKLLMNKASLSV